MILGTVRKLDGNGRLSIPAEMRDKLRLDETISLNVYEENGKIIICPVNNVNKICPECNRVEIRDTDVACVSCTVSRRFKEGN